MPMHKTLLLTLALGAAAFQAPGARLPASRLPAAPPPATALVAAAPRADGAQMSLARVAAGVNLAPLAFYGLALLFKPVWMLRTVMRSEAPAWTFADATHAIAQYLGAAYLSQAVRLVRGLVTPGALASDLMSVSVFQGCLCLTSLLRLFRGIPKDEVTLSLPVGQGLMAALAFFGSKAA
jgi:hypothetical protein